MGHAVTSKGQVTIPKIWREKFGLGAGARVAFAANDRGELTLKAEESDQSDFRKLLESFRGTATAGLTTEKIMEMSRGEVVTLDATAETRI
jgi:antitoxin PrlF